MISDCVTLSGAGLGWVNLSFRDLGCKELGCGDLDCDEPKWDGRGCLEERETAARDGDTRCPSLTCTFARQVARPFGGSRSSTCRSINM